MKIVTVSLNPAVDQTVHVDGFRVDTVNRGSFIHFQAGGKGVNVASFLADYSHQAELDLQVAVTGFLGRENASIFEELLSRKDIEDRFVRIPGATRIGVKIVDEAAQQTTDINMPGIEPSPQAVDLLERTLLSLASDCQWFVLTGSLPPGLPVGLYAQLIRTLKPFNARILLDTSRLPLSEAVQACPHIIKPNLYELEELTGRSIQDPSAALAAGRELLDRGIETVVVSMGSRGALFMTASEALHAIPPALVVKSTVGAGDALVSGLLCGLIQGYNFADCARLATAFSLAAITSLQRELPNLDIINRYIAKLEIRPV